MSVINRMLRDLDKRQQQERRAPSTAAAAAPSPFPWGWVLGAIVIIAVTVTAVMVVWHTMQAPAEQEKLPTVTEVTSSQAADDTQQAALEVTAKAPAVQATQPQQRMQPQPIVAASTANSEAESTPAPVEPTEMTVAETSEHAEINEAAVEETAGTMQVERVELSAEELAEVKLKQAREAMRKGERNRAGSLFEQVIALAPEHVAARSELAAYWYGRGQVASALAVLEQGLALQPQQSRWQLLYAKVLLEGGAYQKVIEALEVITMTAPEALDLLQLRATAANELGRYASAASDYLSLAERTNQGRWWLAAAVAMEDAERNETAVGAYQRALESDDLGADARSYAQQRLQILGEF
ncbi:tetratricopeptide repeat protein [Pseudidiomarina aquimaris]|uniref:tetratricopeptide repeat protein n=1 Tax=Pseudidiomarina aquimaris TaxID=641841 RepID=UPI003A9797F0